LFGGFGYYTPGSTNNDLWMYTIDTNCYCPEVLQLSENNFFSSFSIYPNPASNTFTISIDGQSSIVNGRLSILDVTGRVVQEQTIKNQESEIINCQLSAGIYFVKVEAGERVYTEKLVVE